MELSTTIMQASRTFTFSVNARQYEFDLAPDMPLLWILRDYVRLTGTKYGCGVGQCGACTVLLGDKPVMSCQLTAEQINGQKITTIEGLADAGLHPVQQAWVDEDVVQCGYCQSGQIMMAASLFMQEKPPSEQQIDLAMSKVICRCGTYTRIKKAITRLIESAETNNA